LPHTKTLQTHIRNATPHEVVEMGSIGLPFSKTSLLNQTGRRLLDLTLAAHREEKAVELMSNLSRILHCVTEEFYCILAADLNYAEPRPFGNTYQKQISGNGRRLIPLLQAKAVSISAWSLVDQHVHL
jgi:hypothetical protein